MSIPKPPPDPRLTSIIEHLTGADEVAIITHINPDGDALGSLLAISHGLRAIGKTTTIYAPGSVSPTLDFLPGRRDLATNDKLKQSQAKTLVILDCGSLERIKHRQETVDGFETVINIDHHASNDDYGTLNYVDTSAAATGILLWRLFRQAGWEMTADIATCLYTAIMTDTGQFGYSNANPEVFMAAADLVAHGADPQTCASTIYKMLPLTNLVIMGRALSRASNAAHPNVVTTFVTQQDMKELGADPGNTEGIVEELATYEHAKITVFIRQTVPGVKLSFRSKEPYNCSELAAKFGGGGHIRAAGASYHSDKPFEEIRDWVIATTVEFLLETDAS